MSMSFESESRRLVVHADCADTKEKADQVFLADLYKAGPTMPGDLDPRSGQEVVVQIAGDVSPMALASLSVRAAEVQIG